MAEFPQSGSAYFNLKHRSMHIINLDADHMWAQADQTNVFVKLPHHRAALVSGTTGDLDFMSELVR